MFACSECVGANQTGPKLMKLTTICDISHVISYTRPSYFFWGRPGNKATILYVTNSFVNAKIYWGGGGGGKF